MYKKRVWASFCIGAIILLGIFIFWRMRDHMQKNAPRIFGSTYMTMNNPYFTVLNESIRRIVEANGDVLITRDPAHSQERQNEDILDMIDEGIEVLFANPVDWKKIKPALDACRAAGVSVFVVDTDVEDAQNVVSVIQSDNYEAGRLVAEDMMKRMPMGADIVILSHADIRSMELRRQGFLDAIEGLERYRVVEDDLQSSEIEVANLQMNKILQRRRDIQVVFGTNDPCAIGALSAMDRNGVDRSTCLTYGVDGSPDAKRLIRKGSMAGTAAQYPMQMGRTAAETAYRYLQGEQVEKYIYTQVKMLTIESMDQMNINEWQ